MTVNPTANEVRKWLADNGYDPGSHGRVSSEKRDMCIASTEGYVPKHLNVVHYVNSVRKWMLDNGNGIERTMTIAPNWYRKYNTEHQLEDTTAEVLATMAEEPSFFAEENEALLEERSRQLNEEINLADQKAKDAAEAEAHAMNQEKYTGTAYVTLQMNLSYTSLASTAIFEAHSAMKRAFNPDGTVTETTHNDLREAYGCLSQARVFLDDLLGSFTPQVEAHVHHVDPHSTLGQTIALGLREVHMQPADNPPTDSLIGKRVDYYSHGSFNSGIIKEKHIGADDEASLYRIDFDKGALDGTTHWLMWADFTIID